MRFSATATRRAALLAIVCHVLVAGGLPLPVGVPAGTDRGAAAARACKDRSRPFPCMDRPCGCATAERCFANCCCHAPAERLAWAKAHRVEPAVLAALERRVAAAAAPAVDLDAPDVCRAYRSLAAAAPAEPAADVPDAPAPQTVILRDMLACGGIVTAWLACGTALPPPPRVEPPSADAVAGSVPIRDAVAPSVVTDLPVPPPRAA